jgi:hypothetical protein
MGNRVRLRLLVAAAMVAGSACSSGDDVESAAGPGKVRAAELSTTTSSSSTSTTTMPPTTTTEAPTTTTGAPTSTTAAPPPPPTTTAPPTTMAAPPPPPPAPAPVPLAHNRPSVAGERAVAPLEPLPTPKTPAPPRTLEPYRGLGTWVDAYDFSPQYQPAGRPPTVTADHLDAMAREGIRTLYLQAAKDDPRSPGLLVNPEIIGPMLVKAHSVGIKVVAWYLPKFYDVDSDMRRFIAMRDFRWEGHGFDGIGNDIEWRADVPDDAERTRRLIDMSQRLRTAMGKDVVANIPMPPVLMEVINPKFWPGFPWREMAPLYDVWMPMSYWTFRKPGSPYRNGYTYTAENTTRLRNNIGNQDAPVHPIGGTDGKATDEDYRGFIRAVHEGRCIGASIYDWQTTPPRVYPTLRESPS